MGADRRKCSGELRERFGSLGGEGEEAYLGNGVILGKINFIASWSSKVLLISVQ